MRALIMPVGLDWYAVEMDSVEEVVVRPAVVPVPTAPPAIIGLFNLRGDIVPLFDTSALLGIGTLTEGSHVTVVRAGQQVAGLLASGPPESVELDEPIGEARHASGVALYGVGDRIATLLDVDSLIGTEARGARTADPSGNSR